MKATKKKIIEELHKEEAKIVANPTRELSVQDVLRIKGLCKTLCCIEEACKIMYAAEK